MRLKEMTTYLDHLDRPTELTVEELSWFRETVQSAKEKTGYTAADIIAYDHEKIRGHENALGICHTDNRENPLDPDAETQITIDCWFIHECYEVLFHNGYSFSFSTIEETIAHELAHLTYWRHGRWHSRQTMRFLALIAPEQITE